MSEGCGREHWWSCCDRYYIVAVEILEMLQVLHTDVVKVDLDVRCCIYGKCVIWILQIFYLNVASSMRV